MLLALNLKILGLQIWISIIYLTGFGLGVWIMHSWNPSPPPLIKGGRTFQKLSHLGGFKIFC